MLKDLDIYGQSVSLTFRGGNNYRTTPGALISIFVVSILLAYSVYRTYYMFGILNPSISKKGLLHNMNNVPPLTPSNYDFDFAFGIG